MDEKKAGAQDVKLSKTVPSVEKWPKSVTIVKDATINGVRYLADHPAVVTKEEFTTLRSLGAL